MALIYWDTVKVAEDSLEDFGSSILFGDGANWIPRTSEFKFGGKRLSVHSLLRLPVMDLGNTYTMLLAGVRQAGVITSRTEPWKRKPEIRRRT